jgi:hypothetical protein
VGTIFCRVSDACMERSRPWALGPGPVNKKASDENAKAVFHGQVIKAVFADTFETESAGLQMKDVFVILSW